MSSSKFKVAPLHYSFKKQGSEIHHQPMSTYQLPKRVAKLEQFLEKQHITTTLFQEKTLRNQEYQSEMMKQQTQLLKDLVILMKKGNKMQSQSLKIDKQAILSKSKNQEVLFNSNIKQLNNEKILIQQHVQKDEKYETPNTLIQAQLNIKQQQQQTLKSQNFQQFSNVVKYQQIDYKQALIEIPFKFEQVLNLQKQEQIQANINKPIKLYITSLLKQICSSAFYGFYSIKSMQKMNEQQTKLFFSKNMIYNYYQVINNFRNDHNQLWTNHSNEIVSVFNYQLKQSLNYYKYKFPQKQKVYFNQQQLKFIQEIDNSQIYSAYIMKNFLNKYRIENQRLQFNWYFIKKFINFLIIQTRNGYDYFQQKLLTVFKVTNQVGNQYTLHHKIGTKIPRLAEKYSKQEIKQNGIKIKIPQINRIIIKWIESLQKTIKNIQVKPVSYFNDARYQGQKQHQLSISIEKKQRVKDSFQQILEQLLNKKGNQQQNHLNSIQYLIPQTLTKYKQYFPSIPNSDLQVGFFSYLVSATLQDITERRLLKLLKCFDVFYYQTQEFPFEIFDLFRARCSGSVQQIKQVYNNLKSSTDVTIIRVKNRLNNGNRDFLINFIINESNLVCELQMTIDDGKTSEKQLFYDHFNHLLYELIRSKYGAICQAVNIIRNHQDSFTYFQTTQIYELGTKDKQLLNKVKLKTKVEQSQLVVQGFNVQPCLQNYICNSCFQYKRVHDSSLPIATSNSEFQLKNKVRICQKCLIQMLSSDDVCKYILGEPMHQIFEHISYKQLIDKQPEFIIIVKQDPHLVACGYKKYFEDYNSENQIQYFKCMFGVQNTYDYNNKATQVYLQFSKLNYRNKQLDKMLIFAMKDSEQNKIKVISQNKQIKEYQNTLFTSYPTINGVDQVYTNINHEQNQIITTLVTNKQTTFLLDITNNLFYKKVLIYKNELNGKKLAKRMKKTGQSNWDIIGDYQNSIFQELSSFSSNCKNLYFNFSNMIQAPKFNMKNLLECRFSICQPCEIKLINFNAPQLKTLHFIINEGVFYLQSNFPNLIKFSFSSLTAPLINFQNIQWQLVQFIEIICNKVNRISGFQQSIRIPSYFPNLKKFYFSSLQCIQVLSLQQFKIGEKIQSFKYVCNSGYFKSPNNFLPQFGSFESSLLQSLFTQVKSQSTETISSYYERLNILLIYRMNKKQLSINTPLPQLQSITIQDSYIQNIYFNVELPNLKEIDINMTQLKCLNITKLQNLQELLLPYNRLEKLQFKDSDQMKKLITLNLSYNHFSQYIFQGTSLKDFTCQLKSNPFKAAYLVAHLKQSQYQQLLKQKQDIQPFTQNDAQLENQNTFIPYLIQDDFKKYQTAQQIMQRESKYLAIVEQFNVSKNEF